MSSNHTVLVVDDEVHIVNVVVLNLKRSGYNVIVARDPIEAFEIAKRDQPDLVITDQNMPNGSGLELCQMLKSDQQTTHIPAILLTAYDFSIVDDGLAESNICAVMPKPFSPRELMARAEAILHTAVEDQ